MSLKTFFSGLLSGVEGGFSSVEHKLVSIFSQSGASISADAVADIKLIGSGLTGALSEFESITGLDANTVAAITTDISKIEAAALGIATTVETNIALPVVQQIGLDFAALQSALSGFNVPPAVTNILKAVATLLPYVEAAVGILTNVTVSAAAGSGLTENEARATLAAQVK